MSNLQTFRLKPNPSGKDRTRHGGATQTQLGAEWVDVKNVSQQRIDLTGVKLYHIAYTSGSDQGRWEEVISFTGILGVGEVMRVHSGSGPISALQQEDVLGADYQFFTGRDNYIWNNDRGDCAGLWLTGGQSPFDKACYDPNPPEGAILIRVGDRLVPH